MDGSDEDRLFTPATKHTWHRAARLCGLTKAGSGRALITTSSRSKAAVVRRVLARRCAMCRCRIGDNESHCSMVEVRAEENAPRSTDAPVRCCECERGWR